MLFLALLALLRDANLFGNACSSAFDLLRHRQTVTDNGFVAVGRIDNPLVRNLERSFCSTLVQARFYLRVVNVETKRCIRILFRRRNRGTGLDILGAALYLI